MRNPARLLVSDELTLDLTNQTAQLRGNDLPLRPTPFKLLALLMEQAETVVTKADIFAAIWPDVTVGDDVLTTAIRDIRRALNDDARAPVYIRTLSRRGYMFQRPVVHADRPVRPETASTAVTEPPGATPGARSRLGLIIASAAIFGALIIALLLWRDPRPPNTVMAQLQISNAEAARLDALAPGFRSAVTPSYLQGHSLVGPDVRGVDLRLEIDARPDTPQPRLGLAVRHVDQSAALYETDLPIIEQDGTRLAASVATFADNLLQCTEDLLGGMRPERGRDPRLLSLVMMLCDTTRVAGGPGADIDASEALLAAYPDATDIQALHGLMLASRTSRYIYARNDLREDAILESAASLLANASEADRASAVVEMAERMLQARSAPLSEREALLATADTRHWLSLRPLAWRIGLLRMTGRLADAEYLLSEALDDWPAHPGLHIQLALTRAMRGDHARSRAALVAARELMPENPSIAISQSILAQFYGDEARAREVGLNGVPPHIRVCAETFVAARFDPSIPLEGACDGLDPTQYARMLASLGATADAIDLMEQFDPSASGLAIILHYPEFLEAWHSPRMWAIARNFGLVDYWRDTGIRPDMCFRDALRPVCSRELEQTGAAPEPNRLEPAGIEENEDFPSTSDSG